MIVKPALSLLTASLVVILIHSSFLLQPILGNAAQLNTSNIYKEQTYTTDSSRSILLKNKEIPSPVHNFPPASSTPAPFKKNLPLPGSLQTPKPVSAITVSPSPKILNPVRNYILAAINAYRKSYGLGGIQSDTYTCNFANTRAKEISTEFNHNGFTQRIANHTLPYPHYTYVTENLAETSDYKSVASLWENSLEHAANLRADTPYVCISQFGNYFAYEGWRK